MYTFLFYFTLISNLIILIVFSIYNFKTIIKFFPSFKTKIVSFFKNREKRTIISKFLLVVIFLILGTFILTEYILNLKLIGNSDDVGKTDIKIWIGVLMFLVLCLVMMFRLNKVKKNNFIFKVILIITIIQIAIIVPFAFKVKFSDITDLMFSNPNQYSYLFTIIFPILYISMIILSIYIYFVIFGNHMKWIKDYEIKSSIVSLLIVISSFIGLSYLFDIIISFDIAGNEKTGYILSLAPIIIAAGSLAYSFYKSKESASNGKKIKKVKRVCKNGKVYYRNDKSIDNDEGQ